MYPESHSLIAPKNKRISYGIHSDNGGVDGPHTLWLLWSLITHPLQGTVVGLKANSAQYNRLIKQTRARLNGVCFLTTTKKKLYLTVKWSGTVVRWQVVSQRWSGSRTFTASTYTGKLVILFIASTEVKPYCWPDRRNRSVSMVFFLLLFLWQLFSQLSSRTFSQKPQTRLSQGSCSRHQLDLL